MIVLEITASEAWHTAQARDSFINKREPFEETSVFNLDLTYVENNIMISSGHWSTYQNDGHCGASPRCPSRAEVLAPPLARVLAPDCS